VHAHRAEQTVRKNLRTQISANTTSMANTHKQNVRAVATELVHTNFSFDLGAYVSPISTYIYIYMYMYLCIHMYIIMYAFSFNSRVFIKE